MKSESISWLLLSILLGMLMVTAALMYSVPPWGFPLGYVSFLLASFLGGFGIHREPTLLLERSLWRLPAQHRRLLWYSLAIAAVLALLDRYLENMPLFPATLGWFVLLSMLIGAVEELVFRGLVQGIAAKWHVNGAIWLSAICFAAYKAMLFLRPDSFNEANPLLLFLITLPAGVLLGYARKVSGSLWPPILAHMLFDLILYGDTLKTPWWVW
jgi:membrane protease YdiL (CAAX protease family)